MAESKCKHPKHCSLKHDYEIAQCVRCVNTPVNSKPRPVNNAVNKTASVNKTVNTPCAECERLRQRISELEAQLAQPGKTDRKQYMREYMRKRRGSTNT